MKTISLETTFTRSRSVRRSIPATLLIAATMVLAGQAAALAQAAAATVAPPVTLPLGEPSVTGVWIDHTKRGAIEIVACGKRVCGYVYWVKDNVDRKGRPNIDSNNPDPQRRGKPMCGTQILVNVAKQGPTKIGHVWGGGSIYDPEAGSSFDVELKLISANELSVLGYLGMKFMGEQFTWTRAPAELARCGPPRI
jgi:uncharacterized protein (DUF2147 family)